MWQEYEKEMDEKRKENDWRKAKTSGDAAMKTAAAEEWSTHVGFLNGWWPMYLYKKCNDDKKIYISHSFYLKITTILYI